MKKVKQPTYSKRDREASVGIPEVLRNIHGEKISEVLPVKVQLSLKNYLKQVAEGQGVSAWIREAIIEKLERLEETEDFE